MGHIIRSQAGTYRANWRDETGRQKAKSFRTKKEASGFLTQVESAIHRGLYVDPHAARRILLKDYAEEWSTGRNVESRTQETAAAMLRTHVLPRWGDWPLSRIDHVSVQQWTAELASRRSPATVAAAFGVLSMILDMAVRARLLAVSPCDSVRLPRRRTGGIPMQTISRAEFREDLLPAVPERYRALVCLAAGAGLRRGECIGMNWSAVDLERREVHVHQVVVETSGPCEVRAYPKSRAGVRRVPLPGFAVDALTLHRTAFKHPGALVFATGTGVALRRSTFRRRFWRPALVRAGLLGDVSSTGPELFTATWPDAANGTIRSAEFRTEREAVDQVARLAAGGLRFHDLRHSYATWLVSDGVPVNVVQRLMGHENASTTLNRYVHAPRDYDERVRRLFDHDEPDDGSVSDLGPVC